MQEKNQVDVSVVIPVYNKQDYLERCVGSLIQPTDLSYEIILVDDGSSDNSLSICESLSRRYDYIRVFSQTNKGVSVARNTGIEKTKGMYIAFVDADDSVADNYWLYIKKAIDQSADISFFNYIRVSEKSKSLGEIPLQSGYCEKPEGILRAVSGLEICVLGVWATLYKKSIIQQNNIKFRVGMKNCEDFLFNLEYIEKISNYAVFEEGIYNYYMNEQSVTMNRPISHADDYLLVYSVSTKYLEKNGATEYEMELYNERWTRWIISLVSSWKQQGLKKEDIWGNLCNKQYYQRICKWNGNSIQTKIEVKLLVWRKDYLIWLYMKTINKIKQLIHKNDL